MAFIEAQDIHKEYRIAKTKPGLLGGLASLFHREVTIKKAVQGISFSIDRGEIVGYIGPNGAGKSTTIKMLTGVLVPTSGQIDVDGVVPYVDRKKNARRIGVVFGQRSQLYWDLPVSDTFALYQRLYEIDESTYRANREMFIELLELGPFIDQPARQLSLGQKMKANLALAMLHDPDILYLDEPTIGLDVTAKKTLRKCIAMLNREKNTTIMLTTHDMDDIEAVCRRLILIDEGKKLFDGALPLFKERFENGFVIQMGFQNMPGFAEETGFTLLSEKDNTWTVQADKGIPAKEALLMLIERYNPVTILIKEEEIEQIIERIYAQNR